MAPAPAAPAPAAPAPAAAAAAAAAAAPALAPAVPTPATASPSPASPPPPPPPPSVACFDVLTGTARQIDLSHVLRNADGEYVVLEAIDWARHSADSIFARVTPANRHADQLNDMLLESQQQIERLSAQLLRAERMLALQSSLLAAFVRGETPEVPSDCLHVRVPQADAISVLDAAPSSLSVADLLACVSPSHDEGDAVHDEGVEEQEDEEEEEDEQDEEGGDDEEVENEQHDRLTSDLTDDADFSKDRAMDAVDADGSTASFAIADAKHFEDYLLSSRSTVSVSAILLDADANDDV